MKLPSLALGGLGFGKEGKRSRRKFLVGSEEHSAASRREVGSRESPTRFRNLL